MEVLNRESEIAHNVVLPRVKNIEKKNIYKKIYIGIKRVIDILISAIGMILLLPVFLIISTIIRIDSKGPVFFVHKRIGKDGKEFGIYKFRTMVYNAEDLIKEFTEEQQKEFRECYKLQHDPRVTKIGKFLRKTS